MDTLIEQGVFGIITGILTTVVLFALKVFWSSKVTPFILATRYQGVLIEGNWRGASETTDPKKGDVSKNECSLFLDQKAHEISGSFLFYFKSDAKEFSLDFNVDGYIWEGYVTLNFTPKDKRLTSYATALLKLHDGGQTLIGTWLFRDVENEFVSQSPLNLGRTQANS